MFIFIEVLKSLLNVAWLATEKLGKSIVTSRLCSKDCELALSRAVYRLLNKVVTCNSNC